MSTPTTKEAKERYGLYPARSPEEFDPAIVDRLAAELDRPPEQIRRALANLVDKGLITGRARP